MRSCILLRQLLLSSLPLIPSSIIPIGGSCIHVFAPTFSVLLYFHSVMTFEITSSFLHFCVSDSQQQWLVFCLLHWNPSYKDRHLSKQDTFSPPSTTLALQPLKLGHLIIADTSSALGVRTNHTCILYLQRGSNTVELLIGVPLYLKDDCLPADT